MVTRLALSARSGSVAWRTRASVFNRSQKAHISHLPHAALNGPGMRLRSTAPACAALSGLGTRAMPSSGGYQQPDQATVAAGGQIGIQTWLRAHADPGRRLSRPAAPGHRGAARMGEPHRLALMAQLLIVPRVWCGRESPAQAALRLRPWPWRLAWTQRLGSTACSTLRCRATGSCGKARLTSAGALLFGYSYY